MTLEILNILTNLSTFGSVYIELLTFDTGRIETSVRSVCDLTFSKMLNENHEAHLVEIKSATLPRYLQLTFKRLCFY